MSNLRNDNSGKELVLNATIRIIFILNLLYHINYISHIRYLGVIVPLLYTTYGFRKNKVLYQELFQHFEMSKIFEKKTNFFSLFFLELIRGVKNLE